MTITKEGALASFYTINKAPIKHLKVYFSPKQAGEGTPNQSNIREIEGYNEIELTHCGKNLYNPSTITMNKEVLSNGTLYSTGTSNNWCASDYIPVKPNTTYTASALLTKGAGYSACYDENKNRISAKDEKKGIDAQTVINTGSTGRYVRLTIRIGDGLNTMFEEGSTATKYEPYRGQTYPITFPALGKNLLDESTKTVISYITLYGRGTSSTPNGSIRLPAGTYTFSANVELDAISITDSNAIALAGIQNNVSSYTFTINQESAIGIMFSKQNYDGEIKCQLEVGSVVTTYEPFNNTIYGGYVDLITGELVQTHKLVDASTLSYSYFSKYNVWRSFDITDGVYHDGLQTMGVLSNQYTEVANFTNGEVANYSLCLNSSAHGKVLFIRSSDFDETQSEAFAASLQGVNIVYPLQNPITYQLTPTQFSTLIGRNNIWSNADRVEVEYDLAESNDELYRRRNILLRSVPHIETASGSIAHFETDIAAPIKSAIVRFSPVQEGSGDPSPTNVRAINGWSGITTFYSGKNLQYAELEQGGINGNTSQETVSTGRLRTKGYIYLKPGYQYAISFTSNNSNLQIKHMFVYDVNSDQVVDYINVGKSSPFVFQIGSSFDYPIYKFRFTLIDTTGNDITPDMVSSIIIERQDATSYEPYNGASISTNWQTAAGTIYGGYIDLVTGELVRDWVIDTHEIGANDGTPGGAGTGGNTNYRFIAWNLASAHLPDSDRKNQAVCNILPYDTEQNGSRYRIGGGTVYMILPNDEKSYSVTIAYPERPLNTTKYSLSSSQLKSLKGTNNIWSNAGPVEIKYWTH